MKDLSSPFDKVAIGRASSRMTGAAAKLGISKRYVQKLKAKMRGEQIAGQQVLKECPFLGCPADISFLI